MYKKTPHYLVVEKEIGKHELNIDTVRLLLKNWYDTLHSASTMRGRMIALKNIWYEKYGYNKDSFADIEWEFLSAPKISTGKKRIKYYLTENDVSKMIELAHSDRQKMYILFLSQTGLRISEMINIKYSDMKFISDGVKISIQAGKTNKTIYREISKELYEKINSVFGGRNWLFETSNGHQYTREYISGQIHTVGLYAINKSISAHSLRHYWVSKKVSDNTNPFDIARDMGHINNGSFTMYLHERVS